MAIYLFDHQKLTGHHRLYLNALKSIDGTRSITVKKDLPIIRFSIKNLIQRYSVLKNALSEVKNGEVIHIVYLDTLYILPLIWKINRHRVVIATLHHIPINAIKIFLLKNFSKKIDKIIVHSDFSKDELLKIGIKNVDVIQYPSFFDYSKYTDIEKIKNEMNIEKNKVIITALGGTRYDKGLDILLESFKYLDSKSKDNILLNIVGAPEYFEKEFIENKQKENNINIRSELKFVTDDDFCRNISITDIMVMPYRKIFGGVSGPMTEAVVNKKICIAPKELAIGDLIKKHNLGTVFQAESPEDLALAIKKALQLFKNGYDFDSNYYRNRLTESNFIASHAELYSSIIN